MRYVLAVRYGFSLLGVVLVLGGCLGNLPGAPEVAGVLALPEDVKNCVVTYYRKDVEPVIRRRCLECHGASSRSANYRLSEEGLTTQMGLVQNFLAGRKFIRQDPAGNPNASPLIARALGNQGHDRIITSEVDPDYLPLRTWSELEADQLRCTDEGGVQPIDDDSDEF